MLEFWSESPLGRALGGEPPEELARPWRDLVAAGQLPLRGTSPEALYPAYEARDRVLARTELGDVSGFAEAVSEALVNLRSEYSYLLVPLRRLVARLREAGELAGMDPFVRGVAEVAPGSALVEGYRSARAELEQAVAAAMALMREPPGGLAHVTSVVKAVERAYRTAYLFNDPAPRVPVGEFGALEGEDNPIDRVNRAYYRMRGAAIYGDFITAVSHDSMQARADALRFRDQLRASCPDGPISVLEVGVGGGRYAADFLKECQRVGGEWSSLPFYDRLRYVMGDISPAMLRDALAATDLDRDRVEVLGLDELDRRGPYALQRFNELFDDLTGCGIWYCDPEGKLYRAEVRATFPVALLEGFTAEQLAGWLERTELESLLDVGLERLIHVDWEVRMVAHSASLPELRDVLFPYPVGGIRFLEDCLRRSAGAIRIFDYGFASYEQAPRTYRKATQIVRRYGASATRDVMFPVLEEVAARAGRSSRVLRLEAFVGEQMGAQPVKFRYLAGLEGQGLVSPVVSEGPFSITDLRFYAEIAGSEPADYGEWVALLESRGWVRIGFPALDWPLATDRLEKLALDLDFAVNALFRRLGAPLLNRDAPWMTGPLLEEAVLEMERLGFDPGKVRPRLQRPEFGHFWVLEIV